MSTRNSLLDSIANTIAAYRLGEIDPPDRNHVNTWVQQFDASVQEAILSELDHVLKKTYIPKERVEEILANLVSNNEFF